MAGFLNDAERARLNQFPVEVAAAETPSLKIDRFHPFATGSPG
jgi:hypothetical protein